MQGEYEVYAFVPVGVDRGPNYGMRPLEHVCIGRNKIQKTARFDARQQGLNKVKRVLMHVEVETQSQAVSTLQMVREIIVGERGYGATVFGDGEARFEKGFFSKATIGKNWYKSTVGITTLKSCFRMVQKYVAKKTVRFRMPGAASSFIIQD